MVNYLTTEKSPKNTVYFGFVLLALCVTQLLLLPGDLRCADNVDQFRIAFSSSLFTDVNETDAKASVKAWAKTVAQDFGINADPEAEILKDRFALKLAFQENLADAAGLTTAEYIALENDVRWGDIFVVDMNGNINETYLLLVHRQSAFKKIKDLRGRNILMFENPRMSLAPQWLEILLNQKQLEPSNDFFRKIISNKRLSKSVLSVFFKQTDACLIHRRGFEIMAELNPQIQKQLWPIATSPELIPTLVCLKEDFASTAKDKITKGLLDLHKTPAGRQVLTIFQSDRLVSGSKADLESARRLLASYKRLHTGKNDDKLNVFLSSKKTGNGGNP